MRCSGSPITSTGADAAPSEASENLQATKAFEAVVASMIMRPLSDALGPAGGIVSDGMARAVLAQDQNG